jgi:hypothetical protein
MPASFIAASLQWSAALDQIDNQHHKRNNEQNVNEITDMKREPKQPEHQQDHKYCPEHKVVPFG